MSVGGVQFRRMRLVRTDSALARGLLAGAVALAVAMLGVAGAASAAGSPVVLALTLPGGDAFTVLGHSCGGIQEESVASGFDPVSGYPEGYVFLSTTCSSGGRGSHPTTFTAWAQATWDFTSAVVSYAVVAGPPSSVDPAATPTDANGNELYTTVTSSKIPPATCAADDTVDCHFSAFLARSASYVPVPRVLALSASVGAASGGEHVTVTGTGFTGTSIVSLGAVHAVFSATSDTSLAVTLPAMVTPGTYDLRVTTAGGSSAISAADRFTFVGQPHVTGIAPRAGLASGGEAITITGTDLTRTSEVDIGGVPSGFTVLSGTSISANVPATPEAGIVRVDVISPGGTSPAVAADRFVYAPVSCTASNPCEATVSCAKLTGSIRGTMTVSACSPKSASNRAATFTLAGAAFTWSTSGRSTVAFLSAAASIGRGGCAAGHSERDLSGAVIGGTATYTAFGDAIFARVCVSSSHTVSLVPGTKLLL